MADNEVGVDPELVEEAAVALEHLRDTLEENVPVIVNTMNSYWDDGVGTPVDLTPLRKALDRAPQDAADMRARSNAAQEWLAETVSLGSPVRVALIPWNGQALGAADARYEARALAAAESESRSGPQAARQQIQAIQADIQDHVDSGDTQWLKDFYNQASSTVANLAQTLHDVDLGKPAGDDQNPTSLTAADGKILKTFGTGLAMVDKAGDLSQSAIRSYVDSPNIWSTSMLIKYGPPGSAWSTHEPPTAKDSKNPAADFNPGGYSLLALLTDKAFQAPNPDPAINTGTNQGVNNLEAASNAALSTLMSADAQNKNASWQVMGGPLGGEIAKYLLTPPGVYAPPGLSPQLFAMPEGPGIDQSVIGAFLDASTSGRGADAADSKLSAQAAANIICNTVSPSVGPTKPSYGPEIEKALDDTFARYMDYIAQVSRTPLPSGEYLPPFNSGHGYGFNLPKGQLSNFLMQVCSTPKNYGGIMGLVGSAAGKAYANEMNGIYEGGAESGDTLACLYGVLVQENNNLRYEGAELADAHNAEINALLSIGSNAFELPLDLGGPAGVAVGAAGVAVYSLAQIPYFSTDATQQAIAFNDGASDQAKQAAFLSLMLSLARGNVVISGPDRSSKEVGLGDLGEKQGWYVHGKIIPNASFWKWWFSSDDWTVENRKEGQIASISFILGQWLTWMDQGKENFQQ